LTAARRAAKLDAQLERAEANPLSLHMANKHGSAHHVRLNTTLRIYINKLKYEPNGIRYLLITN